MKRTIRLSAELDEQLAIAARRQGYPNATAFMRAALQSGLRDNQRTALDEAEQRLAACIERVAAEVRSIQRQQLGLFAFVDTFVKIFLTCVPEPTSDQRDRAVVAAKQRYDRLLKSAGSSINGESEAARLELINSARK